MSGTQRPRVFCFDTSVKKYRYYRTKEDQQDVAEKSMSLPRCDYQIHKKDNPGENKWDDPTGKAIYRLTMKFEERAKRPIFVYSDNIDELMALRNYGIYCQKAPNEEETKAFNQKLEKLIAILFYSHTTAALNLMAEVLIKIQKRSVTASRLISNIGDGAALLRKQRNLMLEAWANTLSSKKRKYKPTPTMRLSSFLWAMSKFRTPTEKDIVNAAQIIAKAYREHREAAGMVFDKEIREKSSRSHFGVPALANFVVSKEISRLANGEVQVPNEHMGFAKFEFPARSFQEPACKPRLDWDNSKLILETEAEQGNEPKLYGQMPIGDISSLVLNESPDSKKVDKRYWLRLNGRKIKKPESFGIFK